MDSYPQMYTTNHDQWAANSEYAAYTYQANIEYNTMGEEYAEDAFNYYSAKAGEYETSKNANWLGSPDLPDTPTSSCL